MYFNSSYPTKKPCAKYTQTRRNGPPFTGGNLGFDLALRIAARDLGWPYAFILEISKQVLLYVHESIQ